MTPDPPIRLDGACANCHGPRAIGDVKPLYRRAAALDPFCSAPCARAWHGHSLPVTGRERAARG